MTDHTMPPNLPSAEDVAVSPRFAMLLGDETINRAWRFARWLAGDPTLAEEIVQEGYLVAWRKRDQLHEAEASDPWSWLARILATVYRTIGRSKQRRLAQRSLAGGALVP